MVGKGHKNYKRRVGNVLVELKWGEKCLGNIPAIFEEMQDVLRSKPRRGKK